MGRKFNERQLQILQLYKAINEILWSEWDPLVLNQYDDWTTDEYECYVPVILDLKVKGADADTIAQKLYEIETEKMESEKGLEKCRLVAGKIFDL